MNLSPVVAVLEYLDEAQKIPSQYVLVMENKFVAVVQDSQSMKIVGRFDTRAAAIHALYRDREQIIALYRWPEREHRPN